MRMTPLGVLFLGVSMWWVGCSVETTGDDDDGGEAGESGSAGWGGKAGSGGSGGSSGKGGSGGSGGWSGSEGESGYSGGGSGAVGNGNGGSYAGNGGTTSQGGEAGDEAEGGSPTAGTWSDAFGGEGGVPSKSEGGAGGEGDVRPLAECDPIENDAAGAGGQPGSVGTPYPNCEPVDSEDECELCIQESCCEESKGCWALNPANVCGWGGPDLNGSEIGCYTDCIAEWVGDNAACGPAAHQACVDACQTAACGEIGDATWALAVCMNDNCADECFGATCTY